MVAEREGDIFRNERNSALVVLANARVWASGGWQVTITTADGAEYDLAGFETSLERTFSKSHRAIYLSAQEAQSANNRLRNRGPPTSGSFGFFETGILAFE